MKPRKKPCAKSRSAIRRRVATRMNRVVVTLDNLASALEAPKPKWSKATLAFIKKYSSSL